MSVVWQLILNSIIAGAIYALVALGFNLIYSVTKFFNLAHGVIAVVGGYAVFYLTKSFGLNTFAAIALGVLIAGAVGYATDKFVYLPLRKRKATNMILLVASLGVFTAIQALIAIVFANQFQILGDHYAQEKIFQLGSGVITQTQLIIFGAGLLITVGLIYILNHTLFGKQIKAVADDEEVSRIVGINTNKIIGQVFFIGSAIAGAAGVAIGFDTGLDPTFGLGLLLSGVVACVIGGMGNIYGALLGAYLLAFAENFGIWKISGEWKGLIAYLLLIIFLLIRPEGIIKK